MLATGYDWNVASWVLHVDLDQFIAAVEVLRRPELAGRPVVVGGDGDPTKRGVVSTASYEARAHGVHSGLPLRTAARRCPEAVFLPVDKQAYEAVSARVMAALRESGATLEVMGWDEAFLGLDHDDPEGFARGLQRRVREATQLDCTVGIGQNKLQAKLATGFGKPAGLFRLTYANWFEVLGARSPDALWGIGPKTAKRLAELGIRTVADLAATDPESLVKPFGPATGPWLVLLARGHGEREVDQTPYLPRSHGKEVTFQRNITDWAEVRAEIARLAELVAGELASERRPSVRVVVKVRYAPFVTQTHGQPLAAPTVAAAPIRQAALAALDKFTGRRPVRLLGVRAEFADGGR
jgi:nucleotidyltransferase/DNA polymerase involved in DNA repair